MRIGVLINTMYSPYSVEFIKGVERFCSTNGHSYYVFPLAHGSNSGIYDYHYETLLGFIKKNNIDGLVIATATLAYDTGLPKLFQMIKMLSPLPKISAGLEIEGIPTIKINCKNALKILCEHLIDEHNVKNPIVLRCAKGNFESDEREAVVLETFAARGIEIGAEKILNGSFLSDNAYSVLSLFMKQTNVDFDAVICLNDSMAMGVFKCLVEKNIKIPEDKIITGFDNIYETHSDELNITTISQRIDDFAFSATENLVTFMSGKRTKILKSIDAVPIFRGSCGCVEKTETMDDYERTRLARHRSEVLSFSGMQIYMLHYFLMETQTPVPLEDLYSRLHYSLCLFDIHGFVLALYDNPVFYEKGTDFHRPSSAKIAMTFFNDDSFKCPGTIFNPNDVFLPAEVAEKICGGFTVFPLFAEGLQYGYMLFQFGQYEGIFYQTVFELLAKEIVTSIKISFEQSEKDSLKNQNVSLEQYSQRMHELSFTDDMTGLLNRRGFYEYARRKISSSLKTEKSGLVIYCDMDGLKKINDTYGHDAGDRAIKYEAAVLKTIFRNSDIVGRLGGDEFAVIASGMKAKDFSRVKKSLAAECEKINAQTLEPFMLSISCGFSEFDSEKDNIDELLTFADSSQYEDKRAKKEREKLKTRFGFWRK